MATALRWKRQLGRGCPEGESTRTKPRGELREKVLKALYEGVRSATRSYEVQQR